MARFDESLRKFLFTPQFCFVDIDNKEEIPELHEGDIPSTIIKTPKGFHFYFEDRPKNEDECKRLAELYGGDKTSYHGQLYKIGTIIDGHEYKKVVVPQTST